MPESNGLIKGCPFCGGHPRLSGQQEMRVSCMSCGAVGHKVWVSFFSSDDPEDPTKRDSDAPRAIREAIEAWNRRVEG